jgi:hypothetical protein
MPTGSLIVVATARRFMDIAGLHCMHARIVRYLTSSPRPIVTFAQLPPRSKPTTSAQLPLWQSRKKPNGLYFICAGPDCDVPGGRLCTPLEAGCEDERGRQLCLTCTRLLWDKMEPPAAGFLSDSIRRYNACSLRKHATA